MKVVLVTGGCDPIHSGHVAYFKAAKELGDTLIVGLNSDDWLARKKGQAFMPWEERATVIAELECVDRVINFNDDDGSARDAVRKVSSLYPDSQIIFANGGDRDAESIPGPERKAYQDHPNIIFEYDVGGANKQNSSSWILDNWKAPKTDRTWGYYRVLHEVPGCKVKELTVEPGQSLSMQRHRLRAEYWLVTEGMAVVNSALEGGYQMPPRTVEKHDEFKVAIGMWHQLTNPFDVPCRIVEIQYGDNCIEEDIERKD